MISEQKLQVEYAQYVNRATELIHNRAARDQLLKFMSNQDVVRGVAAATVMIMQRLDSAIRSSGREFDDVAKLFGMTAVVELLIELGQTARVIGKVSKRLKELIIAVAAQEYTQIEISAGRIDPTKLDEVITNGLQRMPPDKLAEMQRSQERVMRTAEQYEAGADITDDDDEQPDGGVVNPPSTGV